ICSIVLAVLSCPFQHWVCRTTSRCIMSQHKDVIRYSTDMNDDQWTVIAPIVAQPPGRGRKRTVNIREVVNAIFYLNKTGCQWEMCVCSNIRRDLSELKIGKSTLVQYFHHI